MKKILLVILLSFNLSGCACSSNNPVERQMNRSVLLDSGINFQIGGLPITLPSLGIGLKFHWRRPTIEEEQDLNLSKLGRWRGMYKGTKPKKASPTPPGGRK